MLAVLSHLLLLGLLASSADTQQHGGIITQRGATHGCTNDTSCLVFGGPEWRCVPAAGAPCRINGHQPPLPPYRPWPVASCACTADSCHHGPPQPPSPSGPAGYSCRSGRCVEVPAGGKTNSTQTCEWSTGCIGLAPNEWLAYTGEFAMAGSTLTCLKAGSVLKKSQLSSSVLPPNLKLSVPPGTKLQLTACPTKPVDSYWVISCANGTICAHPPAAIAAALALPPLPSYVMIGDSISLGYLSGVEAALRGKFAVTHSTGNAGNANKIAHFLDCFLGQVSASKPSVVTVNAGVHDLARGQEWISLPFYTTLMRNITARLVATGARVLLVTTTPVPVNATDPSQPSCPEGILERDVLAYNAVMIEIAKAEGAGLIDLHSAVVKACGAGYSSCALQAPNNPHFEAAGWALLAKEVAAGVTGQGGVTLGARTATVTLKADDDELCGSWSSDPVACVRSYANVEWTSLLPWNTNETIGGSISYGQNAIPIGNGDYGALVSTDGIDTVIVALKAASAYDESGQIFTPGVLNITYSPAPDSSPFKMTFDAGDGSVKVEIGSLRVLLWFDAVGDKLVIQHNSSDSGVKYAAAAESFVGRPKAQTVPGTIHWDCYDYTTSADHVVNTSAGTAFYHYNPPTAKADSNNYWHNQVTGMSMGDTTYESVPNILSSRTSGGLLRTVDSSTLTVTLQTSVGKTDAEWLSEVEASAMKGVPEKARSDAWWAAFWGRSHVQVSDLMVSQGQAWERYITAIQGRAPYNIHFNGMTFHTPRPPDIANPPPRADPQNIDNMGLWAGSHCWWNNCRQPYYAMAASGDFDLLENMLDMHSRTMPSRRAMTRNYYNISGVYWGEYTDIFGADQNVGYIAPLGTNGLDCTKTKRNASWPYWYFPEEWNHYNLLNSLDLAQMATNHYIYSGKDTYMHLQYIAFEVLDFFRQWRTERDAERKMVLWPTQAQEYCKCTVFPPTKQECIQNDMPTVAGLHAAVGLVLASGWATGENRTKLKAFKKILPDVPGVKNGTLWTDGLNQCTAGHEAPQYPIHPFVLFSVGQGTGNATAVQGYKQNMRRTVTGKTRSDGGYIEDPVRCALVGLAYQAKWAVRDRANGTHAPGVYRFPGLYGSSEGPNSGPSGEVLGFANQGLNSMLLQEDFTSAHKLTLLPAWPCDWDLEFKINAALETTITGRVLKGVLTFDVQPASRRADVVVMECQKEAL